MASSVRPFLCVVGLLQLISYLVFPIFHLFVLSRLHLYAVGYIITNFVMLCSDGSQSDCRPTIQRMVTTQVPYRNTPNGSGGSGVGGGGLTLLKVVLLIILKIPMDLPFREP